MENIREGLSGPKRASVLTADRAGAHGERHHALGVDLDEGVGRSKSQTQEADR